MRNLPARDVLSRKDEGKVRAVTTEVFLARYARRRAWFWRLSGCSFGGSRRPCGPRLDPVGESELLHRRQAEPFPNRKDIAFMPQTDRFSKLDSTLKSWSSLRLSQRGRKGRRKNKKVDPTQDLPVVNPHAAAVDIGASEHWVALPPGRADKTVECFGCTTAELKRLADWLQDHGVDTVVMEATGNYWVALYDLLEERRLRPVVVNPRYAKNMSGKKGDIPDCQWMQKLHTFGLFANSFRPRETIRRWRTYLRQRENLVICAGQAIQHMQKALTEMNVQLANVISDLSGETGLRIIDAILAGERDPEKLAGLKDGRIQASVQTLARALEGTWKEEHLFTLEQARLTYAHYQEQIAQCDERIQQHMGKMESRAAQQKASEEGAAKKKGR